MNKVIKNEETDLFEYSSGQKSGVDRDPYAFIFEKKEKYTPFNKKEITLKEEKEIQQLIQMLLPPRLRSLHIVKEQQDKTLKKVIERAIQRVQNDPWDKLSRAEVEEELLVTFPGFEESSTYLALCGDLENDIFKALVEIKDQPGFSESIKILKDYLKDFPGGSYLADELTNAGILKALMYTITESVLFKIS